MSARRDFLKHSLVCGLMAGMSRPALASALHAPVVKAARRLDETIVRLPTIGDGYKTTWTASGRHLTVVNDGAGWISPPDRFFKRSLWTWYGNDPHTLRAQILPGYPATEEADEPEDAPHYHGHGLLAVNGRIYQYLSALDRAEHRPRHWTTAKLIHSEDGGITWRNRDGSTPVHYESWDEQAADKFAFFNAPDGCFSLLTILQMGRDYRANTDGYIYVYGPNGNVDGLMNELMLYRVPTGEILDRSAYRFFAGYAADGTARWSEDLAMRRPVHVFPRGWVNSVNLMPGDLVVETWLPSVVYNEPLGVYMMTASGNGVADDGTEFGKASYLGLWVADTPWGPWRQVHEDRAWTPQGDAEARAYSPQIVPGWISSDGKRLWLVWTDLKGIREISAATSAPEPEGTVTATEPKSAREAALEANEAMHGFMPRYGFNAQIIEFEVG